MKQQKDSSSAGSSAGARGVWPDVGQSGSSNQCAMPSRPIGSASHGESSAAPREPLSPRSQFERDCEVASSRYSAFVAMIEERGLTAVEDLAARMAAQVAETREEIRQRERSLERLNKKIARMSKKKK